MKPATEQQITAVFFMPPREKAQLNAEAPASTVCCSRTAAQSDYSQDTTTFD